jgi:transcriptional regulator with XRE-family HTH domain
MIYDDKKFIGKVIKSARKKAGLNQAELSEKIDMSDKNLGNIENGKQFPQVNNFLRIIEELNLSLKDFGVHETAPDNSLIKDNLLKIICSSSEKQNSLYLKAILFINEISK